MLPSSLGFRGPPSGLVLTKENKKKEKTKKEETIIENVDLIVDIFKKLPVKSLMRFRCLSKEFNTIITNRRDFIESVIARSLTKQQVLIFTFHHSVHENFFTVSSTFSQINKPKVLIPGGPNYIGGTHHFDHQYVRGLICCSSFCSPFVIIYNPTTRQYIPLPEIKSQSKLICYHRWYFGYDPVMDEYKVLSLSMDEKQTLTYHVFTLGRPLKEQCWRKIEGDIGEKFIPKFERVCIDGVIYYVAATTKKNRAEHGKFALMSFNVRSERFDYVRAPEALLKHFSRPDQEESSEILVNYLGKLGCICCSSDERSIYIMDNAEKEWSKITFWLPEYPSMWPLRFSNVTPDGEIFGVVQGKIYGGDMIYYYNIKQNSCRRVEIERSRWEIFKRRQVYPIHGHVETTTWFY